ncbi:MAG: L-threonylcarbamoyladenylate synthase [Verrucomicrobiae bacterium]|nr:L-threonylcarbamoyladenylate synthase [Verrucomicrobiae bacterium]
MKTLLLPAEEGITAAVDFLKQEEVVALPTETVYGLAGNAFSPKALTSIFEAKQRPLSDPLIVHLLDVSWLDRVVSLTPELKKSVMALAEAFWPGPLTLLLPRATSIPDLVTAGLETVAVRVPAHPVFRKILQQLDLPLAAPSANRFGRISPTTATDVQGELNGRIPLIVDGGPCYHGLESTIVWPHEDLLRNSTDRAHCGVAPVLASSSSNSLAPASLALTGCLTAVDPAAATPHVCNYTLSRCAPEAPSTASLSASLEEGLLLQILRPGPITAEQLSAFGKVVMQSIHGKAPGSLKSHYAPRKKLSWFDETQSPSREIGLLAFSQGREGFGVIEILSPSGDLKEAAGNLYGALRRLDESDVTSLVVETVPEEGIGCAIMDRLRRAVTRS